MPTRSAARRRDCAYGVKGDDGMTWTPDFLVELAHQAIDNGADAFVGHGPHVLRGVEIYKGKPIFYGLGEFFYQWQHMDASVMSGSYGGTPMATSDQADVRASPSWRPVNFESVIAQSRFDKGRLLLECGNHQIGGLLPPLLELLESDREVLLNNRQPKAKSRADGTSVINTNSAMSCRGGRNHAGRDIDRLGRFSDCGRAASHSSACCVRI
jgi:hypothetical protein